MILSLKVNFNKSMWVGDNVAASWLAKAASILNCKMSHILFLYLGLPFGGEYCKIHFLATAPLPPFIAL